MFKLNLTKVMIIQYPAHYLDSKTDISLIQVGDRYHACGSGDHLRPPGTECEKRVIKHFDKPNPLPAR